MVQNEAEWGPSQNRFPYSGNDFWLPRCENKEITRIPKPELTKFSGDPLDYFEFVRNFDLHIGNLPISNAKKLTLLLQYCDAEVRRQLSHFTVVKIYIVATLLLEINYGSCMDSLT